MTGGGNGVPGYCKGTLGTNKQKLPPYFRINKAEIKEGQVWTEARPQGELTPGKSYHKE